MSDVAIGIPAPLRALAGGAAEVRVAAGTVGEALGALVTAHPALRRHLYAEGGGLRSHVNIYVNEDDVRWRQGEATAVGEGDLIVIVPSIAGGSAEGGEGGSGAASDPTADLSRNELARYARHLVLDEVGMEGQRALRSARVLIVGAGGLGSPVALYLAAAGVGTLGVVDYDRVELSNLQRQVLYGESDVGRPKAEAAAARLRDLNPNVRTAEHALRLTSANAMDVIRDYDVVVDGTDNFPTRYLVNDCCVLLGKPYVYGSILRFEGQVSVFDGARGPCYRCLFREPPPPGLVPSCAEGGVLGVLPGIIGSLQALETIKLILGVGETLLGRLVLFDALAQRWRELRLRKNPDCPVCGEKPTITAPIDYEAFCGITPEGDGSAAATGADAGSPAGAGAAQEADSLPDEVSVVELAERLERGERIALVDIREPFEWRIANLEEHGARLIPMGQLEARLGEIDPETPTVLYCHSGRRSLLALHALRARGLDRVSHLRGGIDAWAVQVDPSLPRY